jgi:predicted RNA-binding protein with EMAP domain
MKLTDRELQELKYHYVDRVVDNMSTKDLVQYVFDDMLRYIETIPEVEFLEDCQDYWEEHFDDVVKDIKEYANSKFKKPIEDRNVN